MVIYKYEALEGYKALADSIAPDKKEQNMRFHNLGCYVCFIKYKSCLFAPEFYDAINFANIVTLQVVAKLKYTS